jgi:uncharacterized protein
VTEEEAAVPLLDVNLLVALTWPHHLLHDVATTWFEGADAVRWATTPVTEAGLLRLSMNPSVAGRPVSWTEALALLDRARQVPGHEAWGLDADLLEDIALRRAPVAGHRQVSDLLLLAAARRAGGRLATLDAGLPETAPSDLRHLITVVGSPPR